MARTFVYNAGEPKEHTQNYIEKEFGLFFDGTLNNKNHTEIRLKLLNKLEKGKKVKDFIIQPGDSEQTIAEKEEKSKYLILPTDDSEVVKEKESLIETRRENKDAWSPKEKKDKDFSKYKKADDRTFLDRMGVDNSFMNDYTNVARIWQCCSNDYRIYIEGIGTEDLEKDNADGFQFGSGDTGVRGKVRKGCEALAKKIKPIYEKDISLELTIDVFGFSRGAAAARNFLYEINYSQNKQKHKITKKREIVGKQRIYQGLLMGWEISPIFGDVYRDSEGYKVDPNFLIDGEMPKYGYLGYYLIKVGISKKKLEDLKIKVRFIGIYDTVSSFEEFGNMDFLTRLDKGIEHDSHSYFEDDVEQLNLNNLGTYRKIVHFTAKDEHRINFSLTKLSANARNSIERAFPGVHCDIGGAYETGTEIVDEIITRTTHNYEEFKNFIQWIMREGWYRANQLEIKNINNSISISKKIKIDWDSLLFYNKLTGTRFLRKEYSYIPLHFMEEYFREQLLSDPNHIFPVKTTKEYSIEADDFLIKVKKMLREYIMGDEEYPFDMDWNAIEIKRLMHNLQSTKEQEIKSRVESVKDNIPSKTLSHKVCKLKRETYVFRV